jgi:hypothetical protein
LGTSTALRRYPLRSAPSLFSRPPEIGNRQDNRGAVRASERGVKVLH